MFPPYPKWVGYLIAASTCVGLLVSLSVAAWLTVRVATAIYRGW